LFFPFHDRDTKIPPNRLTKANTIIFSNEKPTFIFPKVRKPKAFILAKQKHTETARKEMGGLEIIQIKNTNQLPSCRI